jgi:hypothetical protein
MSDYALNMLLVVGGVLLSKNALVDVLEGIPCMPCDIA